MEDIGILGFILLALNVLVSYKGFKDAAFFEKNAFEVDAILLGREWRRLVASGFLHVGWLHLLFNMVSLAAFCGSLEQREGIPSFLLIYFASLVGGNLLSLFIHRNHGDYSAVGASGAVCGVIFACIALFPGIEIGLFGVPFFLPSWLYGLLFVVVSIYGIRSQAGNIGHDAHLGGAAVGILAAVALRPSVLATNLLPIALALVPILVFLFVIVRRPEVLLVGSPVAKKRGFQTLEDRHNAARREKEEEVDRILEKIQRKGIGSLTAKEKAALDEFSKK